MPTANLTPSFVRSAACKPSRRKVDYYDINQRGFLLEVRSSSRKTFYQRYTDGRGRTRQYKLGSAEIITADQAREKGREIVAAVLLGIDPQQARGDLREVGTLADFVRDRYMPHAKQQKRSWQIDEVHFRLKILPVLGRYRLDEITHEHVSKLLLHLADAGFAAGTRNRALAVLQHAFHLAKKWKIPGAGDNPAQGISPAHEPIRQRFLSAEEAQRFVAALALEENRPAANAIMLLLLTGGRRNEIRCAQWSHVDWEQRTLLVPMAKSGKPRTIALSTAALALLRGLTPVEGNAFIFPGETGRPPHVFYPFCRICRKAGITGLRLHDLRHSFASFLVNNGVALYTVQGLLGHTHARTTQRYAHLAPKTMLDATEVISEVIRGVT